MAGKSFQIMLLCLILLLDSYRPASLNRRCISTNNALSCIEVSGKFLEAFHGSDFLSISITNSDMTQISQSDLSTFPGVTTVHIYDSKFLLPKQRNILSLLIHLEELYIEDCNATEEIKDIFYTNKDLQVLRLPGNKIKTVKKDFFSHLKLIEDIDLSHNEIMHIDIGAFSGLLNLKILNLKSNKIGSAFDPIFLTLPNHHCIVCRRNIASKSCIDADLVRCGSHQALDQLWWMAHTVNVDLHGNPVCAVISKTRIETAGERSQSANFNGIIKCSIEDRCSKHSIRRILLLDMCGLNSSGIAAPEITTSSNNKDINANTERGSTIYIANIRKEVLIGIGFLIVGSLIGSAITLFCKWKSEKKLDQNSANKNSSASRPSERVNFKKTGTFIDIEPQGENNNEENESSGLIQNKNQYLSQSGNIIVDDKAKFLGNEELPLHSAIMIGSSGEDILALLEDERNYSIKNEIGDSPIHIAARVNDHKTVKSLLKKKVEVNVPNNSGDTPLILAARENNPETLNVLLEYGADSNLSNFYDVVPLHLASAHGNLKMVEVLLENNADLNKADQERKTSLFYASAGGHEDVVKYLLDKGALNKTSPIGGSSLHIASWNNHLGIVNELLNSNADVTEKDSGGFTPLHKASRKGHVDVIKRLLKCKEMDVNVRSNGGNTPLHQAVKGEHVEAIKLLLEKGANVEERNNKRLTPLEITKERKLFLKKEIKQLFIGKK